MLLVDYPTLAVSVWDKEKIRPQWRVGWQVVPVKVAEVGVVMVPVHLLPLVLLVLLLLAVVVVVLARQQAFAVTPWNHAGFVLHPEFSSSTAPGRAFVFWNHVLCYRFHQTQGANPNWHFGNLITNSPFLTGRRRI